MTEQDNIHVRAMMDTIKKSVGDALGDLSKPHDPKVLKAAAAIGLDGMRARGAINSYKVIDHQILIGCFIPKSRNIQLTLILMNENGTLERQLSRKKFSSRRKARIFYKEHFKGTVYVNAAITPIAPISFITLDVLVSKDGMEILNNE